MEDVQWKAAAMLTARRTRTTFSDLATCVKAFNSLPEAQRAAVRIIVPGCIAIDRHAAVRTFTGDAIGALVGHLSRRRCLGKRA